MNISELKGFLIASSKAGYAGGEANQVYGVLRTALMQMACTYLRLNDKGNGCPLRPGAGVDGRIDPACGVQAGSA